MISPVCQLPMILNKFTRLFLSFPSFFVLPLLKCSPLQSQKRHVGNDNIHIVWSEHRRDYNPATITSQFNDAHIVIYPLDNGLNRVQVFKKDKVTFFPF